MFTFSAYSDSLVIVIPVSNNLNRKAVMFTEKANNEQVGIVMEMSQGVVQYAGRLATYRTPIANHALLQLKDSMRSVLELVVINATRRDPITKDHVYGIVFIFQDILNNVLQYENAGLIIEVDNLDNEDVKMSDFLSALMYEFTELMG